MKKYGLVIADENELNNFSSEWKKKNQKKLGEYLFWEYEFKNITFIVGFSRIGVINASIAVALLKEHFNVLKIFNYGAVGGSNKFKLYDIVIPRKFYFGDVITPWYDKGVMPQEKKYFLNNFSDEKEINILTTSQFISDKKTFKTFKKDFYFDIIDMEAFSYAFTSAKFNIPFYSVKCISDIVGEKNNSVENINERIKKAGKKALNELEKRIEKLHE